MSDNGSNSVSIVAILAILILVGLVLYFVFRPTAGGDGEFQLDVNVDEDIGMMVPQVPSHLQDLLV